MQAIPAETHMIRSHSRTRTSTASFQRVCGFALALLLAFAAVPAAAATDTPATAFVLSKNQVRSLKLLDGFSVARIDWNRSTIGRPLAYSLRGEALKSFKKYLPEVRYDPDEKPQQDRLNSQGILVCRLILRTLQDVWALFMRCELGNQLSVIIRREDLVMFNHEPTREEGRLLMDKQIERLALTFREAKRKTD